VSVSGHKPIIGILGGIGSGKSTVAGEFGKLGCAVVDADKIAHNLLDEGGVRERIVGLFGGGILDSAGKIDRRELARVVFGDVDKLSLLTGLIHPLVLEQVEGLIEQYNSEDAIRAIVLDMPLLVEVGWDKRCDRVVFVECERPLRAERAKKAGFFDENGIKIRENFQISLDKKVNVADNTIYNNSDFSALVGQVTEIFSNILGNN